jgi:hypothetical protein
VPDRWELPGADDEHPYSVVTRASMRDSNGELVHLPDAPLGVCGCGCWGDSPTNPFADVLKVAAKHTPKG